MNWRLIKDKLKPNPSSLFRAFNLWLRWERPVCYTSETNEALSEAGGQGNEPCSRQKHIRCFHSSSKAKGLMNERAVSVGHAYSCRDIPLAQVCGSVSQGYLLPPSCPLVLQQTESLTRQIYNQTQLTTQSEEWMLTKPRHRTHGLTQERLREQDVCVCMTHTVWTSRSAIVWRMICVRGRTASAKRSQHSPNTLGRRGQLWRRPCPPASILFSTRWRQMSDQNSLQAAIAHAFAQPSATREPGKRHKHCFLIS